MDPVVATDLEGTLTAGATWRGVGRWLSEHGHRSRYRRFFWPRLIQVVLARAGLIDLQAFRERWMHDLTKLLAGMTRTEIDGMAIWVMNEELWPGRREDVIAELRSARERGARLIVASGTYLPLAELFAWQLGAEAIGTVLAFDADGRTTGGFTGAMGTGEEKLARLTAMLDGATIETAYGDTAADIPMLSAATTAVAVYPDRALAKAAHERGWRIIGEAR
jgi:phosphoserine phosphatase